MNPVVRHLPGSGIFKSLILGLALLSGAAAWAQASGAQGAGEAIAVPVAARNDAAIAAIAPGYKFAKDGAFTVGISSGGRLPLFSYAEDAKTIIGYHPEFARNIAESLGRRLELVVVAWADWPLGLTSGKFDAVIANVTVTEERKEKFDFSTYRKDLVGFYVRKDSAIVSIKEPRDVAGLTIITDPGTNQESILLRWDAQNRAAGLKPVQIQYYDDDALKDLALQSGRADVIFSVNASLAHRAAVSKGKTRLVGVLNGGWPNNADIAIATRKGSGLAEGLAVAVDGLIASGEYRKLLDRWGLGAEAVEKSQVNPPGLPRK